MKEFEKLSNKIINSISLKIANYFKDLYIEAESNLSSKLTNDEIKSGFKNGLLNYDDLKEIVTLNIDSLDIIVSLKEQKNGLGVAYSQYLIEKTINKVYKILDKEIFNKKEKNNDYINSKDKILLEKIKEKKDILENNKKHISNIKQQKNNKKGRSI